MPDELGPDLPEEPHPPPGPPMGEASGEPDWFAEPPPPLSRADAAPVVRGPARGLAVAGWLGVGVAVWRLFLHLILLGGIVTVPGGPPPGVERRSVGVALSLAADLVFLAWGVVVVLGAGRLRRRRSYGLAVAGAVVALIPANYAWVLGLPFGIWALTVLLRPEVQDAFRESRWDWR